jgi:hypothetical protein
MAVEQKIENRILSPFEEGNRLAVGDTISPQNQAYANDCIGAELARRPESREEFATDDTFRAIRLEPYLLATARAHPDISGVLSRKNGCRLLLRSDPP